MGQNKTSIKKVSKSTEYDVVDWTKPWNNKRTIKRKSNDETVFQNTNEK